MITYFAVILLCIYIRQIVKKIKIKGFDIRFLGLIPFTILFLCANKRPDIGTYEKAYYNATYATFYEQGMLMISNFLSTIGLHDFIYFKILVIVLVFYTFKLWGRLINNIQTVILLYSLFIMFFDLIQIRYTIATMFSLISLYYSVEEKYFFSIFFAILSIFFHRLAALIGIIILCVNFIKPNNDYSLKRTEVFYIIFTSSIVIFFSKILVGLISQKFSYFQRIRGYITASIGLDSWLIWAGYEIFLIIAIYYLGYNKFIYTFSIKEEQKRTVNMLFRFMLYGIATSGFLLYVEEFNRIYRFFFLVGYMIYSLIEDSLSAKNKCTLFYCIFTITIIFTFVAMSRGLNLDAYW